MPLSTNAITAIVLLIIMWAWNDLVTPLIYLQRSKLHTIPVGLMNLSTQYGTETHLIMAGSCMALLPILVIYIFSQKYFIEGIATRAVKG